MHRRSTNMTDNFINHIEEYQRDIKPLEGYLEQMSFYVSKMRSIPIEEAKQYVRDKNQGNIHNPTVQYYQRDENKDTHLTSTGLKQYIDNVVDNDELIAPTFTTYMKPDKEKSLLSGFLAQNVKLRSASKKAAFKHKSEGDIPNYLIKNNEQGNYKLYNNSLSGTFCSNGTTLLNPTAHSTLTSTVRIMSSISNAVNEKLIEGNRHYYNSDVTLCNVIYLASLANLTISTVMDKYGIYYPTVEDTIGCVKYSTDLYWSDKSFVIIEDFIRTLTPVERAAVVYIGDLHHIKKHNDGIVRKLLDELSSKVSIDDLSMDEMIDYINDNDDLMISLAQVICMDEVKGKGLDHRKMDIPTVRYVYGTMCNIKQTLDKYDDLLRAFFTVTAIPNNISRIKSMIRKTVVLSDTDSTVYSTDNWIIWFFGKLDFSSKSFALANSIGFLTTMVIKHSIRIFSANVGIGSDKKDILSMKPEYNFPVFSQALVSKHYFTNIAIQEGNVWDSPTMEIKGAMLKASTSPVDIVDSIHNRMSGIIDTITKGDKVSILDELQYLRDMEVDIRDKLLSGNVSYFNLSKVKAPEAYADPNPARTPYVNHLLWLDVFSDKYGTIDDAPYSCIKIPTTLNNKTKLKEWVDSIVDVEFKDRLARWLSKYHKTSLPTIYINVDYIKAFGIPMEIKDIINTNKIIIEITRAERMTLEMLGYFIKPNLLLIEE